MPTYVLKNTVKNKLPSNLPDELNDARIETLIGYASAEVDEMAGRQFSRQYNSNTQKFPDITDDPATPQTIELCTMWLVLSYCYEEMGDYENRGDEDNDVPNKIYYRRLCESKMKKINAGDIDLDISGTAQVENIDKYPTSSEETDMKHWNKISNLDTLLPPSETTE